MTLEPGKKQIVAALQKYDFVLLFPVNPATLAKYPDVFQPLASRTSRRGGTRV